MEAEVTTPPCHCPVCGRSVDALRAGAVAAFEAGMVYYCSRHCKQRHQGGGGRRQGAPQGSDLPPTPPPRRAPPTPPTPPEIEEATSHSEAGPSAKGVHEASEPEREEGIDTAAPPAAGAATADQDDNDGQRERALLPAQRETEPLPGEAAARRPFDGSNMKLFLRFVAAGLLTAGAMFGPSVWPDLPAAYLRWGPAVLALTWLAYVAVNSLLKQGARAFIDEALVASAAALVFAAGLQSQNDALAVATPALVAITWLGRWLEGLNRRHLIRQTRAALDERDAPPVQDDQLWGDRRQVDDADPAWTNAPREDTLGLPPSTEPKDLLPQIVAPHGRRASQLARAAGRAASWLPLAALPTAILLALALLWWHTPPARALLLAASVLLAIVPRGLRRSWVGPLLLATGRAAKDGVRFPDGAAMEAAGKAHWVVFDGQGTMTDHDRQVAGVVAIDELSEEEVLALAAGMEQVDGQTSLGRAIVQEAQSRTLTPVQVRLVRRHAGQGLSATTPKGEVLLGTRQMLLQQGISVAHADEVAVDLEAQAHSVVFLALAGRIQGVIAVANRPRPDAEGISKDLTALQVEPVLMTDDSQLAAEALGRQLGFDHVRAEIPPEQWAEQVQFLRETGHGVAMVTRLPRHEQALAAADVGLTLHNDDDSADTTTVHLAGDAPSQAVHAVAWARAAWRTARQLVFVAIVLLLAQMGLPFIFSGTAQTWHIPLAVALLSALTPALVCWPLLAAPRHPLSSRDES